VEETVQKKRRMMVVMRAVHRTPPSGAKKKTAPSKVNEVAETAFEAENSGGPLETTLSEIDRIIDGVVPEKETNEVVATETSALRMKNVEEASSERGTFDLRHLGGQQLSEEDMSELREFAIAGGYQPRSILFGSVDEEILGCIPDHAGAKIVNTLTKTIGFPKLERDLSRYRKHHITGSLVYLNFKVQTLLLFPNLISLLNLNRHNLMYLRNCDRVSC
jgi:hypothetical protein